MDYAELEHGGRECMALVIYTESRNEPFQGQVAVAEVLKERMRSPHWPEWPCDIAAQDQQFHGYRDWPRPSYPWENEPEAWDLALKIVDGVMLQSWTAGCGRMDHFYSGPAPDWSQAMKVQCTIGGHTFLLKYE